MIELPSDNELINMSHFPFAEGPYVEFKQSFCNVSKLNRTICSFLNSKGGYLISGVEDETYKIIGVQSTLKELDNYILSIDNIFHQKIILTTEGYPINPECIKARYIKLNKDEERYLIIAHIIPTEGHKYKMKDGTVFYRINASNLKISSERMFCLSEINYLLNKTKNKMASDYNGMFNYIKKDNEKTKKELNILKRQIKETNELLCLKILSEKKLKEKEIKLEKELEKNNMIFNLCNCFVMF